jgi:hypothetical protein
MEMGRIFVVAAALLVGAAVAPCFAGGSDADGVSARVQAEDPAAKETLVDRIMTEAEQRSGRGWDPRAKEDLKQGLMARSYEELSEAAGGEHALEAVMGGRTLGSATEDWVFTPVPSCRILDTRPGSGAQGAGTGPYTPGTPHAFLAAGSGSGCTIPYPDAKAISANFIAVGAAGNGNLRVWPWDSSLPAQPSTAVITYTAGFNTSNGVVIPICNTATATGGLCSGGDLLAQTNGNSSHVAIDVFGYFAAPVATALDCTTVSTDIPLVAGVGQTNSAITGCAAGYTITGAGVNEAHSSNSIIVNKLGYNFFVNSVLCRVTNNTALALTATCEALCCRVPGR